MESKGNTDFENLIKTLKTLQRFDNIVEGEALESPRLQEQISSVATVIEGVQSEIENMRNEKYLQSHEYEIWKGNDGRWRTYLPDAKSKNGRKLIAKSSREKLETEIIQYYKAQDESQRLKSITMKGWYPKWLEYKALQTRSDMYIRRIGSDWDNYYRNDPIINIPLVKLEFDALQEWALRVVKEKELTKKQYYNMTVIFRQSLEYAVQKKIISESPFEKVHVDAKLFRNRKKPADKTQVFLTDEQPQIVAEAWKDFHETGAVACLAIPLAFQTGMRLGEIVAIKESDINGNYIHVQRMEVRKVHQIDDKKWSKQTFTVADYTKTEAGDREIYLSAAAREILRTIITCNHENGYSDEGYLFLNAHGRIHYDAVNCRIRKYCRHIGIEEKAMHKIRKTYISALIDSGLNINEIRKLAGHEDERTTYGNYCFNRKTNKETENLLEKALN